VPTAAMWQGDLSNLVDSGNPCTISPSCPLGYAPVTIYNPSTTNPTTFARTPFPNNQIPGPYNQTAVALKALTALPCCGSAANNNPFFAPDFTATYPDITSNESYTAKWDQNLSDKDRLSVRYTRSTSNSAVEGGNYANPINDQSMRRQGGSVIVKLYEEYRNQKNTIIDVMVQGDHATRCGGEQEQRNGQLLAVIGQYLHRAMPKGLLPVERSLLFVS